MMTTAGAGNLPSDRALSLSFLPLPFPQRQVCRCAFLRAARTVFALKFCVVANKILVSHLPSSRIRRSVICCATLFLATTSPRAARTCAASERKAFSARLESSASDRDSNISTCLDLETFLYTRLLSGRQAAALPTAQSTSTSLPSSPYIAANSNLNFSQVSKLKGLACPCSCSCSVNQ